MTLKTKRLIWYLIYFANWAIILWFWWAGSGDTLLAGGSSTLLALGRLAGLAAAYMILVQVFLMGRTPWLERRKRYYLVECAWCKKRMRWKRAEGPVPYTVSHSICAQCFAWVSQGL